MAERRHELVSLLEDRRVGLGLTQTEVAARMGTSQSAVARLESGDADVRLSTIERYAAAIDHELSWQLTPAATANRPAADGSAEDRRGRRETL